ncbi:hypothetical protein GE09DRAFT_459157 [Coniochaeta sp. 2T2.1]|nr:hypothetical protein GE09DRAFT_459157 [Coniochaeta sp. 2T2.1]
MPIRNPFARQRPGLSVPDASSTSTSTTSRPGSSSNGDVAHPGFERVDTVGSKASSSTALSVRSSRSQDNGEYKMSVVNDSGVYLPPSPVEKEAAHWPRRYLSSRSSTDTKTPVSGVPGQGEIEHFSISRESFDSYRRSFDISARSPIVQTDASAPRQSLDSRFPRLPYHRSSLAERRPVVPATAEESNFEDVGLNDENKQPQHKKRSFFSKFGGDDETPAATAGGVNGTQQTTPHAGGIASRLLGGGRKRGQSGQGAELGVMPLAEQQRNKAGVGQAQVAVEAGVSG